MRPPCTLSLRDRSKKSAAHYGSGEIMNERCTNPTTHAFAVFEDRELTHDCSIARAAQPDTPIWVLIRAEKGGDDALRVDVDGSLWRGRFGSKGLDDVTGSRRRDGLQ
jgi:hypothetical protein